MDLSKEVDEARFSILEGLGELGGCVAILLFKPPVMLLTVIFSLPE